MYLVFNPTSESCPEANIPRRCSKCLQFQTLTSVLQERTTVPRTQTVKTTTDLSLAHAMADTPEMASLALVRHLLLSC